MKVLLLALALVSMTQLGACAYDDFEQVDEDPVYKWIEERS